MGIFEYECDKSHVTTHFVSLADKPATIPCGHEGCGLEAKAIVSAAKTTFHANDRKAIKRSGH